MTAPFPPEWVDAAARALVREQTMGACDGSWPRRCAMCDCFRSDTTAAYERQHMQAALEVVVPLIRADEARRIAEKIEARADQLASLNSADCTTHAKTLYAAARIVREEIA